MKKSIMALLLAVVMLFSSVAAIAETTDEKVELTLAVYNLEDSFVLNLMNNLDGFYAENPNIEVKLTVFSGGHLAKILALNMAESDEWDVTFCGSDIMEYVNAGAFECLDPYMEKYGFDLSDSETYLTNAMGVLTKVNGKYYGVPFQCDTRCAVWNMNVMAQLGLTEADIPQTMDELWALCDRVKNELPDVCPLGLPWADSMNILYQLPFFLWADGKDYIRYDETTGQFASNLDVVGLDYVKILRKIGELNEGYADNLTTWQNDAIRKAFGADKLLVAFIGPWFYYQASFTEEQWAELPEKAVWTTIPSGTVKSPSSMGGHSLGMNKYSKHKDEVFKLMMYIYSNDELNAKICANGLAMRVGAYNYPPYSENDYYSVFGEQLKSAQTIVDLRCPVSTALAKALFTPVQEIMLGMDGLSDEEAADWLHDVLQECFDAYY